MIVSYDPRTGAELGRVPETEADDVRRVVLRAAAAAGVVGSASPRERQRWLGAIADALESRRDELAALADSETALGMDRLRSELDRAAGQLRFYGQVAVEGSYVGVTIDESDGVAPSLVRVNQPLGPVAVFGASNFPFAFSVLGNDTGAALAAGCPVVIKGHPAHPRLSVELADLATRALSAGGAPDGTFALVHGHEAGVDLVKAPEIQAVAFTGSQSGGLALWRLANERPRVIPVFAEMGTVNPVVVTRAAAAERLAEIARGFVGSFTLGSGQFCTKPGIMLAPAGHGMAEEVGRALVDLDPSPVMLTESIAGGVASGIDALLAAGAEVVAQVGDRGPGWSAPATVLRAAPHALRAGSRVLEECFGAVAVVVEYNSTADFDRALGALQPSLVASVFSGGLSDVDASRLIRVLSRTVGRVVVNGWPTGVAYTWAQQHGGPWPSTSAPAATSVGAAGLDRFVRPVAYQAVPEEWLPAAAQEQNPWSLPRRINGKVVDRSHV
ncbi:NADP-dependent aldehyde dehydrogenase [Marmoricola sp. URHA0025 HA25]